VFEEISAGDARLVNWHDLIVARSNEVRSPAAARAAA
jgi:hypothetical protein